MIQRYFTASRLRAVNFSLVMAWPGLDSARKMRSPPMPCGRKITVSVRNPMPPIRCVVERHRISPWGSTSMSRRMVAPVVVYPDIISKKASANEGMEPCSMKGSPDTAETSTQPKTAMKKASRMSRFLLPRKTNHNESPSPKRTGRKEAEKGSRLRCRKKRSR